MINRGVLGIELLAQILHVSQRIVGRRWTIEHGEAVAQILALVDQRLLDGRSSAARRGENADFFDADKTEQAGSLFWIDVVLTDVGGVIHRVDKVVNGIVGLQRILNKGEQDILNPFPVNINVIRDFRKDNRSIRIWGGRVITSDPDWIYVNVRRLMIFLEQSMDIGMQWVVFEPNAEPLWARVKRTITNFLTTVWRNGALEGTKPEEAFFVKCDNTTMTQDDIDNGRLIVVIGVAPVRPAEFVIIRIGLWTAGSQT